MEVEKTMIDFVVPIEDKMQGIIKVVGVGGGGCNAVRNMYLDKVGGRDVCGDEYGQSVAVALASALQDSAGCWPRRWWQS